MRRALLILALAVMSCAGYAQTDMRTKVLDTKPGLDKAITLSMRAASLKEAVAEIQAQTGVKMRAEREIAEDKCTISVKDKPARDVLKAIAKCFDLGWAEAESGGVACLSLCMDKESQKAMNQRLWDDYSAIIGQFDGQLKPFETAIKAGTRDEPNAEEIAKLPVDEQHRTWLRFQLLSNKPMGSLAIQYLHLTDEQKKELINGKQLNIPKGAICDDAKAMYPEATEYKLWVERSLSGYLLQGSVLPMFQQNDWFLITTALFDDTRYDKAIQASIDALAKDKDLEKTLPAQKSVIPAVPQPGATPQTPATPSAEAVMPTVPKPGEGSGATPTTMSDGLLPIAEALGVPVVAQYLSEYGTTPVAAGKALDQLAGLCRAHKFTAEKNGDFLCVKSVLWHRLRDREIPEATIKRWQKEITGLPCPTFDVLVEMGNMSWGQIRSIIKNSQNWFALGDLSQIARAEYALKLYGSLKADHIRMMGSGQGVPVSALKPDQQFTFMQAFEGRARPDYASAKDASWPRTAVFTMDPSNLVSDQLFGISNMKLIGTESLLKHVSIPQPPAEDPEGRDSFLAAMQTKVLEVMPDASKALVDRIATDHPEVSRKSVSVYAYYQMSFKTNLGEGSNSTYLAYCVKVQ